LNGSLAGRSQGAYTGPTLSGCAHTADTLTIEFNTSLLRGDTVKVGKFPTPNPGERAPSVGELSASVGTGKGEMASAGTQLYVQTDASLFCIEQRPALNSTGGSLGFNCKSHAGNLVKGTVAFWPLFESKQYTVACGFRLPEVGWR
jgi:hypothetical protein